MYIYILFQPQWYKYMVISRDICIYKANMVVEFESNAYELT